MTGGANEFIFLNQVIQCHGMAGPCMVQKCRWIHTITLLNLVKVMKKSVGTITIVR